MTPKLKQALMIAGFGLLSVVAVAGWTRNPRGEFAGNDRAVYGQPYAQPQLQPYAQPYAQPYTQGAAANAPSYGPSVNNNCPEPITVQSAAYAPPVYESRYRTYSRPRVVRTYVEQDRDYVVRRRNKRSTGKSAAIVAGSAGAGAAIGALAGGGKGAAIGALSGGAAGFVYDRLTHNK
jgi:hypothetical protein